MVFDKLLKYYHLWRWKTHETNRWNSKKKNCGENKHSEKEGAAAKYHWLSAEFYSNKRIQKIHPKNIFFPGIFKL